MRWGEFRQAAPKLADLGEDRLDRRTGVLLIGTIRKDGTPRISPVEPVFSDGDLYLGMMWRSRKALDLLRDSRFALHNTLTDRLGDQFIARGRAIDVQDPDRRERYCVALKQKIDWRPEEPYHLFSVDVEDVTYIRYGEEHEMIRWDPVNGIRRQTAPNT